MNLLYLIVLVLPISLSLCQDDLCNFWNVSPTRSIPATCGTCCICLNDILDGQINGTAINGDSIISFSCSNKLEFMFRSGDYRVNKSVNNILSFEHISTVIIRGEPNVTVDCLDEFCLVFTDVTTVVIKNMHFKNCGCHHWSRETYYVMHHYTGDLSRTITEIFDVRFTNSKIFFHVDVFPAFLTVTIKDTIFENCVHQRKDGSILQLYFSDERIKINITLQNLNVRDNNSSFLLPVYNFIRPFFFSITLVGRIRFSNNSDMLMRVIGGRLYLKRAKVDFNNNSALLISQAPMYFKKSTLRFEQSHIIFKNNMGSLSGGIFAEDTVIVFSENTTVQFIGNSGELGGALRLNSGSTLIFSAIESNISLNFTNNVALKGGALFVKDDWNTEVRSVFDLNCSAKHVKVIFRNNSALLDAGNHIYGGWLGWRKDESGVTSYNFSVMNQILTFENKDSNQSDIASDPIRVCLCADGHLNCSLLNHSLEIYGQAANISLVAVGQMFTKVTGYVEASLIRTRAQAIDDQWSRVRPKIESLQPTCTNIIYRIYSDNDKESLNIKVYLDYHGFEDIVNPPKYSDNASMTKEALLLFEQLSIRLKFKKCPLGFLLDNTDRSCSCNLSQGLTCDFNNHKIHRNEEQWINVTNSHLNPVKFPGVIVHQYCPYDYCRRDSESLSISFEEPDEQCAFNRAGILCGSCITNFSRVLGSSKCKKCSNLMLAVILLSGLIAGLVLVIVLMGLNLTVSVGTINGLIFYANIIEVQSATFFATDSSDTFLSIYISWINLNLGIESCFYNGLDSYFETWLQLLFPIHIWLITSFIIVASKFSSCVSKISGKNAVQVLATLFLLSYTKILQFVLTVVSSTKITYPDGYSKTVWLYDSNIEFLKGKHLLLFLSTLLLLVLVSVPYTLSVVSIQWLYKISHYRAMFWVQKLKPLFDAYTGPYRPNHRYWTGLLLIARIALLIIFSINQTNNTSMNLLAIIIVSFALIGWSSVAKGVYERQLNNILEVIFLCNLGITSALVLFDKHNTKVAVNTSTSIALIIFIYIIIYHAQRQLLLTKLGSCLKKKCSVNISILEQKDADSAVSIVQSQRDVSSTVVELKEPLLDA